MGACTVTIRKVYVIGDRKEVIFDVTPSSSYATGGDTLTATQLGLDLELNTCEVVGRLVASGGTSYEASYDHTNNKLMVFGNNAAPGAAVADPQVTATTNLTTFTGRCRAVGKGKAA